MTILSSALDYLSRGFSPIPIPRICPNPDCGHIHYGRVCANITNGEKCTCTLTLSREQCKPAKGPLSPGWQTLRLTPEDAPHRFHESDNVGLLLGTPGNGLIDVDIDCAEAEYLAPWFLPATGMVSGRKKRPRTHYWYRVQQKDVRIGKLQAKGHGVFVELRGTGGQTVVPPSRHPDDDEYCWDEFGEPAEVDFVTLKKLVYAVGFGCLLARAWPVEGMRHDAGLAVGGFLWQLGWPEEIAAELTYRVAGAAGHKDPNDRRNAVLSSYKRKANDQPAQGGKTMRQTFGEDTVNTLIQWSKEIYTPRPAQATQEYLEDICLEDVPDEEVSWLWYPYIPLGYVTVLAGDSYQGKSRCTAALVTAATSGSWLMTDERSPSLTVPSPVTLIGTEDLRGTLKTRLRNYGATISLVRLSTHIVGKTRRRLMLNPHGIQKLKERIQLRQTKLVVIDPLQSFLPPGRDMNSTSHMRELFDMLSDVASETQCAIVIVQHFSKRRDVLPEDRIAGTKDFYNRPRSVLVIVKTDEVKTDVTVGQFTTQRFQYSLHAFAQLKGSIAGEGQTIEFQLTTGDYFSWTGMLQQTARELLQPAQEEQANDPKLMQAAKQWLVTYLQGDAQPRKVIEKNGKPLGFSPTILKAARIALNIDVHAEVEDSYWYLPGKYQAH